MAWILGGVWVAAVVGLPAARAEMLAGFETGGDLDRWSTGGRIRVERIASPAPPEAAAQDGPQGNAAGIVTPGQSGFFIKAGELPPDLTVFDTLRFWVHRAPAADAAVPCTIEVRFYEQDGNAWFWRKVVLDQAGWTQVEVPLKWVRWSATRVPRWDKVDRLGIFFRDAAEVVVDSFSLTDDPPQNGPENKPVPSPEDIARLAFGDAAADTDRVRIDRADDIAVITDAPDCEVDTLLEHLGTVAAAVQADMPFAGSPTNLVMLVVFAEEDRYQEFPVKLSERLGAQSAPITSSGYTVQGIATSSWHPRHGTLRPVFSHEFIHALLSATLQLENKGEWFQEGLASHYQLRFHPQANMRSVVSDSLKEADADTLKKVCSGARIPLERYWVAATLCRMLLADPALAAKLPAVVAAMQKSGSTALEPLLPQLGLSWEELDERWRTFCRQNYGG
jgi:hypothetical protein